MLNEVKTSLRPISLKMRDGEVVEIKIANEHRGRTLMAYAGGATLEEVGKEFGITRERVRQIRDYTPFDRLLWQTDKTVVTQGFFTVLENQRRLREKRKSRKAILIAVISRESKKLGRPATTLEIARVISKKALKQSQGVPYIMAFYGRRYRRKRIMRIIDALWSLAGFPRTKNGKNGICKRGHNIQIYGYNVTHKTGKTYRHCGLCACLYWARRARHMQVNGRCDFTYTQWQELLQAYQNKCAYCNKHLTAPTHDHVIPLSRGGEHTLENIVPACWQCNRLKYTRTALEFVLQRQVA